MDGQKLFSYSRRHKRLHKAPAAWGGKRGQEQIEGVSAGRNKKNEKLINLPYSGELETFNQFSLSLGRLRGDLRMVSKCLHGERSNKMRLFNLTDKGILRASGWQAKALLQRNGSVLGAEQLR